MRNSSLEDWNQLLLVAGKTPRDEGCAQAKAEHHSIDGRHAVRIAALTLGADIGGRRELAFGDPVDTVIFDDVEHPNVASNGVAHMAEPDGKRIAVARDSNVN